jgi:seryl-tRNA synthetase
VTSLDTALTPLEEARRAFRRDLLDAGLLIGSASAGIYGRSARFEAILTGLDRVLTEMAAPLHATALRFPPVYPRADFERTDYIASFPDLSGVVSSFEAGDREHRELLAAREAGEAWDGWLTPADVVLTNAICHPLYATLEGRLPEGRGPYRGSTFDILGWGFRHEPSLDPMRMQSFRMHEFVYVGDPVGAQSYRDEWLDRALETLASLGLPVDAVPANDPFFGRAGKMLVSAQLRENLKIELTVPMYGDLHEGTAIASANCQRDHLTAAFGIRTADGEIAHGACLAFGMERTVLALLRTHGLDPDSWPLGVRALLGV